MFDRNLARKILLTVLSVAIVQSEIAFAVDSASQLSARRPAAEEPGPAVMMTRLTEPKTNAEAEIVIRKAEQRTLAAYLGSGSVTIAQIAAFDADIAQVFNANALLGLIDDPDEFLRWWNSKKAEQLAARDALDSQINLQLFVFKLALEHKISIARANGEPSQVIRWLRSIVSNSGIRSASDVTVYVALGLTYASVYVLRALLINGVLARGFNMIVNPLFTVFEANQVARWTAFWEKQIAWLNRRASPELGINQVSRWAAFWAKPKAWLHGRTSVEPAPSAAVDANADSEVIREQRRANHATIALLNELGYSATFEQVVESSMKAKEKQMQTNQVLAKIALTPTFQNGREAMTNALVMRPMNFAHNVSSAIGEAERYRQGVEQAITTLRSFAQSPEIAQEVERLAGRIAEAAQAQVLVDETKTPGRTERYERIIQYFRDKLIRLMPHESASATRQANAIVNGYQSIPVALKQAATALASHLYLEVQYRDMNRGLPEDVARTQRQIRNSFGLDFFHRLLGQEVVKQIQMFDFELQQAERVIQERAVETGRRPQERGTEERRSVIDAANANPASERASQRLGEVNRTEAERASLQGRAREVTRGARR